MIEVSMSFVCRVCTNQPASMDRTSIDIDDSASLELVDMICYMGDMLSVDGDDDAAVEDGEYKTLLTNKGVFILIRGKLYTSCVHELYVTWRRNLASE